MTMEETTISIFKAQPTIKSQPVKSVNILIDVEFPEYQELLDSEIAHQFDAELLCKTLADVLPGGTFDRLLVEMMKTKVSHFVVSYTG